MTDRHRQLIGILKDSNNEVKKLAQKSVFQYM